MAIHSQIRSIKLKKTYLPFTYLWIEMRIYLGDVESTPPLYCTGVFRQLASVTVIL